MRSSQSRSSLVLGASGSLGGAIARELLTRGCSVGLHFNSNKSACEKIGADFPASQSKLYAADFSDPDAAQRLAEAYISDFSRIDALVWAAGIVRDAPLLTQKEEDLRAVLNVNLRGLFLVLKAFSRQFMKQKSGAVVALSSHAALSGRAGGSAYAMAHAGGLALVKSAARELGAFNVRVNSVVPPFVPDSGMGRGASAEFLQAAQAGRALKTTQQESAAFAKFVADILAAENVSGQVLSADSRII